MSGLRKDTSGQKIRVFAFADAGHASLDPGEPVTGDAANITAKVAKDWGTATAITDTNPTEVEDGYYLFDLTQAETNADVLDFYPQNSTAGVQVVAVPGTVYTVAVDDYKADVSSLATSAALATVDAVVDAIKAVTDNLPNSGALTDLATAAALATVDGNVDSILTDTGTTIPAQITALNDLSAAEVNAEVDTALADYDAPTKTEMDAAFSEIKGGTWSAATDTLEHIRDKQTDIEADTQDLQTQVGTAGAGLTGVPWNASWDAEVQSECEDALTAYGANTTTPPTANEIRTEMETNGGKLDHLWEMTEDDAGTRRLTTNALEQAPSGSGGDATDAKQDAIINHLTGIKGSTWSGTTDSLEAIRDRGDAAWSSSATGTGDTEIDHDATADGGGNLYYKTSGGAGIGGATVIAYLKSEYDAGTYTQRGRTVTEDDGSWAAPLMLNSGQTYTIYFELPGQYGPDTAEVTVP